MAYREYSPEELRQMQLEAAQRVREMQRQARARLEGSQQSFSNQTVSQPAHHNQPDTHQPEYHPSTPTQPEPSRQQTLHHTNRQGMPSTDLFGLSELMGMDGDRLTLLLLMLLLSSQGQCSPGLMAALFWLMADS